MAGPYPACLKSSLSLLVGYQRNTLFLHPEDGKINPIFPLRVSAALRVMRT